MRAKKPGAALFDIFGISSTGAVRAAPARADQRFVLRDAEPRAGRDFGMLNIVNFAHGAQYMLGAFGVMLLQYLGLGYWWALDRHASRSSGSSGS